MDICLAFKVIDGPVFTLNFPQHTNIHFVRLSVGNHINNDPYSITLIYRATLLSDEIDISNLPIYANDSIYVQQVSHVYKPLPFFEDVALPPKSDKIVITDKFKADHTNWKELLDRLIEFGFNPNDCIAALMEEKGDVERAANLILSGQSKKKEIKKSKYHDPDVENNTFSITFDGLREFPECLEQHIRKIEKRSFKDGVTIRRNIVDYLVKNKINPDDFDLPKVKSNAPYSPFIPVELKMELERSIQQSSPNMHQYQLPPDVLKVAQQIAQAHTRPAPPPPMRSQSTPMPQTPLPANVEVQPILSDVVSDDDKSLPPLVDKQDAPDIKITVTENPQQILIDGSMKRFVLERTKSKFSLHSPQAQQDISKLVALGFAEPYAMKTYDECGGNYEAALKKLLSL